MNIICPDCREILQSNKKGYFCSRCNSNFDRLEADIIDLLPKHNRVGEEIVYRQADFRAQFQYFAQIRQYFYTNRLVKIAMSWGHRDVIRLLGNKVIGRSVDLGVGRGDHYAYINNPNQLIGVDYDLNALKQMRAQGITAPLYRTDLTRLPFTDEAFDTIRSTYTFEHLYYLEVCLEEIYRTLKNEGVLVASFPIVGGWLMDFCSRLGPQREFRRRYGLNYNKILKVEHCNTSRYILEAVRRIFIIDKILWAPLRIPSHNFNMFITFLAHKNTDFLKGSSE